MCPFCADFEKASSGWLAQYAEQGKVAIRYSPISILDEGSDGTEYSTRAANALAVVLDTAGPEAAKKFHDELYAQQPAEGSAGLSDDQFIALAVASGAERSSVEQPIRSLEFAG